ncbi:MAG: efflux transporter outer membrane subunit [Rhodanobacter sp.]
MRTLRLIVSGALALVLAGCVVGPDFQRPATPDAHGYGAEPATTTAATAHVAAGQAQHFVAGGDVSAHWWTLFHSAALNSLVEQSLAHNADLAAAQAALTVARENVLAGRGGAFPAVSAGFSASRRQDPPGSLAAVPSSNAFLYNLFTPQVSVSYAPDLFGLNRRTRESAQAQAQAVRYQTLATRITLSTNVVLAAVQEASLRAQVDATRQLVALDTRVLQIGHEQLASGYIGRLDVAAQESQLAQVNASLPPLLKQLGQQQHLLAVLVGRMPAQATAAGFDLTQLQLPPNLPLSLPSRLVRQRPDVLQAEANLHAASAQVGVAIANRLPNIVLSADLGSTALAIGQLFKPGTGFWDVGADLATPIFQGGTLLHQERGAKAAYAQAAAQYRSTVLTAMQDVADTLTALQQDADGLHAAADAASAAQVTLDLSRRQWQDGYAGYLALLSAEQSWQQAHIALVQAQALRLADTAALFQALGGGWWNDVDTGRDDLAVPAPVHVAATRDTDEN